MDIDEYEFLSVIGFAGGGAMAAISWYLLRFDYIRRNKLTDRDYFPYTFKSYFETFRGPKKLVSTFSAGLFTAVLSWAFGVYLKTH